jgi:hypothetical protein
MIFTQKQWQELQQDKFHIGAAPIGPSELGRNSRYVFALPARYNYAYPVGYEKGKRYPMVLIIHGGPAGVFVQSYIANRNVYPIAAYAVSQYFIFNSLEIGSVLASSMCILIGLYFSFISLSSLLSSLLEFTKVSV